MQSNDTHYSQPWSLSQNLHQEGTSQTKQGPVQRGISAPQVLILQKAANTTPKSDEKALLQTLNHCH